MRAVALVLLTLGLPGCGDRQDDDGMPAAEPPPHATDEWPGADSPVNISRERALDLTGDGSAEVLIVSVQGERYDSLEIGLTVVSASRDTLWRDGWSSRHYFKYDSLDELPDTAVARIVRAHVDSLLHDTRFTTSGMPDRLAQGAGTDEAIREAVRYHLAELDWRGGADLTPADPLPVNAQARIDAGHVGPERVAVVIRELRERPVFWYYAGGEETYAIAWSDREHAFVRLYSCC